MSYSTRTWKKFLNDNSFDLLTEARIKDVKVKYPHWNTWNVIDLFVRELTKRKLKVSKYIEWLTMSMQNAFQNKVSDYDPDEPLDEGDDAIEDIEETAIDFLNLVQKFDKNISKIPEKDIMKYKRPVDLEAAVMKVGPSRSETEQVLKQDIDELYRDQIAVVQRPHTTEASCFLGRNTKWCISGTDEDNLDFENQFINYTKQGYVFAIIRFPKIPTDNPLHRIALRIGKEDTGNYEIIDAWDSPDNDYQVEDALPAALKLSGLKGTDVGDLYDDITRAVLENARTNPPDTTEQEMKEAKSVLNTARSNFHSNFDVFYTKRKDGQPGIQFGAMYTMQFAPGEFTEDKDGDPLIGQSKGLLGSIADMFAGVAGFYLGSGRIGASDAVIVSTKENKIIFDLTPEFTTNQNAVSRSRDAFDMSIESFKKFLRYRTISQGSGMDIEASIRQELIQKGVVKANLFYTVASNEEKVTKGLDSFVRDRGIRYIDGYPTENAFKKYVGGRFEYETDNENYQFPPNPWDQAQSDALTKKSRQLMKMLKKHMLKRVKSVAPPDRLDSIVSVLDDSMPERSRGFSFRADTWNMDDYEENQDKSSIELFPVIEINYKHDDEDVMALLNLMKLIDGNKAFFKESFDAAIEDYMRTYEPGSWVNYDSEDIEEDVSNYFNEMISERSRQTQIYAFYLMLGYRPAKDTDDKMRGLEDIVADIRAIPSVTVVDVRIKNQRISETDFIAGLKIKFIPSIPGILRSPEDAKVKILQAIRKTKGVVRIFKISAGFEKADL